MFERFIFADETEREGTRELVTSAFPLAMLCNLPDPEAEDFITDMYAPIEERIFFRWAISTHGPARLLVYSCYHMSLALCEPPDWMIMELSMTKLRLTDGT